MEVIYLDLDDKVDFIMVLLIIMFLCQVIMSFVILDRLTYI